MLTFQLSKVLPVGSYMSRKFGKLYIGASILWNQVTETIVILLFIFFGNQRYIIFTNTINARTSQSWNWIISHAWLLSIYHLLHTGNIKN